MYFNNFKEEYQVEFAKNGAEALIKYAEFSPKFVVLDLAMPLMDGHETLIRLLKQDPAAFVFIASAVGSSRVIDDCLKSGAKGFIEKPYTPKQLLTLTKNLMKKGADYSKEITLFDSCAKIIQDNVTQKISDRIEVFLDDIDFEKPIKTGNLAYEKDIPVIKVVKEPEKPKNITVPPEHFTICCDNLISGGGLIISTLREQDLRILRNEKNDQINDKSYLVELFNIMINKIVTEIVEHTNRRIKLSAPRLLDGKEHLFEVDGTNQTHLTFEISRGEESALWKVYICLS